MEQIIQIEKALKDKMLAMGFYCEKDKSDNVKISKQALHRLSKDIIKKPTRRPFALCMPFSATNDNKKKVKLIEGAPPAINITLNKKTKKYFYLEHVVMETEGSKGERKRYQNCPTRIPEAGNSKNVTFEYEYDSMIKNLAKDIYFAFAENKLENIEKLSRMQQFNVNAELNADIKKFLNSFDAFEFFLKEEYPHIYSYNGFEKFGIESGVEYLHIATNFYRMPTKSLFDVEVKNKIQDKIDSKKLEFGVDENQ